MPVSKVYGLLESEGAKKTEIELALKKFYKDVYGIDHDGTSVLFPDDSTTKPDAKVFIEFWSKRYIGISNKDAEEECLKVAQVVANIARHHFHEAALIEVKAVGAAYAEAT